jgi:hypothetical protein
VGVLDRVSDVIDDCGPSVDELLTDVDSTIVENVDCSDVASCDEVENEVDEVSDDCCSVVKLTDENPIVSVDEVSDDCCSVVKLIDEDPIVSVGISMEVEETPPLPSLDLLDRELVSVVDGVGMDDEVGPKVIIIEGELMVVDVCDSSDDTTIVDVVTTLGVDSTILEELVWFPNDC